MNPASNTTWSPRKKHYSCKVCKGLDSPAKEIFIELHRLVLEESLPQMQVRKNINTRITLWNETHKDHGLEFLNDMNLSIHFRRHLDPKHAVALALRNSMVVPVKLT